jgi:hypothetical protein
MFYGTTTLVALGSVDSRVQSGTLSSVRAEPNVNEDAYSFRIFAAQRMVRSLRTTYRSPRSL